MYQKWVMARSAARLAARRYTISTIALTACCMSFAAGVQAAGKPEKAFLESKLHILWAGLQSTELTRATANQLYLEHARDARVLPGLLRYAQSVPLPLYDLRSSFDSISEIYYEDFAHANAAFESPENRVGADPWMIRFSGGMKNAPRPWRPMHGFGLLIVHDHVMVDGHEQGYKWFNFMRRKEGVSKEQADAYMRDKYAPALAKLPGIRRYVLGVSYVPKGATGYWGRTPPWDAVDMIWFDDLDAMHSLLGSIDYQENVQRAAETTIVDQSKTVSFATTYNERVPFAPRYEGPSWEEMKPAKATSTEGAVINKAEGAR